MFTHPVARNTFDVCACGEEAPLAGQDGEDCVGVVVEDAQGRDGGGDQGAAKGVEGFGTVELGDEELVLF